VRFLFPVRVQYVHAADMCLLLGVTRVMLLTLPKRFGIIGPRRFLCETSDRHDVLTDRSSYVIRLLLFFSI